MDLYTILNVSKDATQEQIKKAYRKLASTHHPDKGGDTAQFQKIAQAYEVLSDSTKRAQYDAQQTNPFINARGFAFNEQDMENIFGSAHPFGHFVYQTRGFQQRRKNADLNIRCKISLKQSYTGAELEASYQKPSGNKETVVIKIPEGVRSGQTIRYPGMGDDSDQNLPRGNLNITVLVEPNGEYDRVDNDLVTYVKLNPVEAMVGCTKTIKTLTDKEIQLKIRPGVQQGTEFITQGFGFKVPTGQQGNFRVVIIIEIPAVTDAEIKEQLEEIYKKISNPPIDIKVEPSDTEEK